MANSILQYFTVLVHKPVFDNVIPKSGQITTNSMLHVGKDSREFGKNWL
jgi:hypothetical protein